jgi:transposase
MRKVELEDADTVRIALQQEIARSPEARYDHRLHGLLLVCEGFSAHEVARLFGDAPRTVAYWVQRFKAAGLAGLQEGERPGRPAALDAAALARLGVDLRRAPRAFNYGQNLWDGKLLRHHLETAYEVELGVRQCQRLFRRLRFRRRKPRPLIAKADPEAQRAYKKTPPAGRLR